MKTIRATHYIFFTIFFLGLIGFINMSCKVASPETTSGGKGGKELGDDAPIRFDGFYYKHGIMNPSQQQRNGYTYLRFYPDKTVVILSSASEPEKIAKNFGKSHKSGQSKFKIYEEDGQPAIRFSIKDGSSSQSYEGPAGKDTLKLRLYGGASSYDYTDPYYFYQVENPRD